MISPRSYVDVLINQGFEHSGDLKARVNAWLELLEHTQPSVVIADHSPTVLLAQRLYERAPCIVGGNGFYIPPVVHPFPLFDKRRGGSREGLIQREQDLLNSVINPVLQDLGGGNPWNDASSFSPIIRFGCSACQAWTTIQASVREHTWGPRLPSAANRQHGRTCRDRKCSRTSNPITPYITL